MRAPLVEREGEHDQDGWPISERAPVDVPVIPIAADLDQLVDAIYVSPKAPVWFANIVRALLARYSRQWQVHHSELDSRPLY